MRLAHPVLRRIVRTWLATVFWLMNKRRPISRLDSPSATHRSTSASRVDSPAGNNVRSVSLTARLDGGRRPYPTRVASSSARRPSSAARWTFPRMVIVASQSNRTSAVQSGDPLRSASWRADTKWRSATSGWPHSSVSPASSRSAGPKQIVNAAIRLRPLNGRSSAARVRARSGVTEREAGLGEEREAGRPHRIAGNRGKSVWCQGVELRSRVVEHSQLGVRARQDPVATPAVGRWMRQAIGAPG